VRTRGPMAAEIMLDRQRPAQYVFSELVERLEKDGQSRTAA
jgi:hypothetical protein